jgi:hypothetical protein
MFVGWVAVLLGALTWIVVIPVVDVVVEARGRNRHRTEAHVAAQRFRVPDRPEPAQLTLLDEPSYRIMK